MPNRLSILDLSTLLGRTVMGLKDEVGLMGLFVEGEEVPTLKEKYQKMSKGRFMVDLRRRFEWDISEVAVAITYNILQAKTDLFFDNFDRYTRGMTPRPLTANMKTIKTARKTVRQKILDLNFIQPGHGHFSNLYNSFEMSLLYAETLRSKFKKNQTIPKYLRSEEIRHKIKMSFYGSIHLVDCTIHLRFPLEQNELFEKFVKSSVLRYAKLSKVLRQGIRLRAEVTEVISFESFMRTYNRILETPPFSE